MGVFVPTMVLPLLRIFPTSYVSFSSISILHLHEPLNCVSSVERQVTPQRELTLHMPAELLIPDDCGFFVSVFIPFFGLMFARRSLVSVKCARLCWFNVLRDSRIVEHFCFHINFAFIGFTAAPALHSA